MTLVQIQVVIVYDSFNAALILAQVKTVIVCSDFLLFFLGF